MTNPLLMDEKLPPFAKIEAKHVKSAIDTVLSENREALSSLLERQSQPTWESTVMPIDALEDRLQNVWAAVRHMNAVVNTDELREAYNNCLPQLSEYHSELGQNKQLYEAYKAIYESASLDDAQKQALTLELREFQLSGIELSRDEQQRFKTIVKKLSELTSTFENNVMDATDHWSCHIQDESRLKGLPESAKQLAKQKAAQKNLDGYLVTLDFPSYYAVITYSEDRALREEIYTAYVTRASDQGPAAGQYDNSQIMVEILQLRQEKAHLLGYQNYAEYSLVRKMSDRPEQVIQFLEDLVVRTREKALQEFTVLCEFAASQGIEEVKPWDISYLSEKLKLERYQISDETFRPYFPLAKVLQGLFAITEKLYEVHIKEVANFSQYHPDTHLYTISDARGEPLAQFYLDLFARNAKRGGAWMDECRVRWRREEGNLQLPVAYLTCNFAPAVDEKPALLTHDEVLTLFHEFGHGLHHMLTRIEYPTVSGINGVPWDAVELPSQFYENWCWHQESLALISGHYETNEPLPLSLLQNLLDAKNFLSAMALLRQLEFSLFDFRLHMQGSSSDYSPEMVQRILDDIRSQVAVVPNVAFNRMQNSFLHIFAGGYAAGYFSYLWAEVLSADAFSRFEDEGIFNKQAGSDFKEHILEKGGAYDIMDLFVAFRGREPTVDALLRHRGIQD